ncbi:MAG TPA: BCCT family transporter [Myxococcota bacterium]|nr:BCCT family transporter [Myxococcota bacterium]
MRASVFIVSLLCCGLVAIAGIAMPKQVTEAIQALVSATFDGFDWFYLLVTAGLLVLAAGMALSPWGSLKLGRPEDEPEFSTASWLSMLFAAGMGSGLVFWGVAEPLWHFTSPPPGQTAGTAEAARQALVVTNFHWGLHAWAIYGVGALVLAWFGFAKGRGFLPSAPITTVFPRLSWLGAVADVIAVVSVVFGVAASLGMGTLQMRAGISEVFGTSAESIPIAVAILCTLCAAYMASASTSLDKGIRILSNLNLGIAICMLLYVVAVGPTSFLMRTFTSSVGDYASQLVGLSTRLYPFEGEQKWSHDWTLTYLMWWIAWVPFVGIFIARISKGRTVRGFLIAVVCVPTIFSMLWFAVFGGTGLHIELFGPGGLGDAVVEDVTTALFTLFSHLPGSGVLSVTALVLLFVFLVTSADSASYVLGMLTTRGDPDPPVRRKLLWGLVLTGIAAVGLLSGGGIPVLKALALVGALPFTIILLLHIVCMLKSMGQEHDER